MSTHSIKTYMRRGLCLLAAFICILSAGPMQVNAADDVDIYYQSEGGNYFYGVQVKATKNISEAKSHVHSLREAGYNAYLYQKVNSSQYRVLIGIFNDKSAAEEFAITLHKAPAVKGVELHKAYGTGGKILDSARKVYTETSYGSGPAPVDENAERESNVDTFKSSDGANTNQIVAVKLAESTSIANCETCVERLRIIGYNAYIYEVEEYRYWILVGAFESYADAAFLREEIRKGPAVKGLKVANARTDYAYISDWGVEFYSDYVYSPAVKEQIEESKTPERQLLYGSLLSWSGDEMEVELMEYKGLNSKDRKPLYKSTGTTKEYDIGGADICYNSAWGDDRHFSSISAAMKHKVEGWDTSLKELLGDEIILGFTMDGDKVEYIEFLYTA